MFTVSAPATAPATTPQWRSQWAIAVYTGPALDALAPAAPPPVLTGRHVTDVRAAAVADPFLVPEAGGYRLFFEVWNTDRGRGEIGTATSPDGLAWTYGAIVLREPFHLSYPQVVLDAGVAYMIPETRQAGGVHLYRAEAYPGGWRRVATLVEGPYADATVVRHDGRWWMFAQRGLDELRLFLSDRLDGDWREHPRSPLWAGNRSRTRPGGRVLDDGRRLLRFAQDGWPTYGYSLRAFEILTLTPQAYAEREIARSPILRASRSGWNAIAMHHLDAVRRPDGSWLAVVDGAAPGFY
ncbi:MAG: hypothetical protein AB7O67_17965 [Vicinamibacterales bacterium]